MRIAIEAWTILLAALSCSLAGVRVAHAESPPTQPKVLHFSWVRAQAAESCPDAQQVQADIEGRLGTSPFLGTASRAVSEGTIEALVTRDGETWKAAIVMRSSDSAFLGSRTVESAAPSCASLAAAAGLAIALMIEPQLPSTSAPGVAGARPPASAEGPPNGSNPALPSGGRTDAAYSDDRGTPQDDEYQDEYVQASLPAGPRARPRGALALGLSGAAGLLPEPGLGLSVRGEVGLGNGLFASLGVAFLPEQWVTRGGIFSGFSMTLGAIGPCYRVELSDSWSLSSCGSLVAGAMHVAVEAAEPIEAGDQLWLGASAGLRLGFQQRGFLLSLGGEALVHFKRRRYTLERPGEDALLIFAEPGAAGLAQVSTGVEF